MNNQIDATLIQLTKELLKESKQPYPREIDIKASLQSLNIDSLARAELFRRIEQHFNIILPDTLLVKTDTLHDIADYLNNHETSAAIIKNQINPPPAQPAVDRSHIKTLVDILLLYNEKTPERPHIYFQHENGTEEIITYSHLLERARKIAQGLQKRGFQEGETAAIMLPTTPEFFYSFFGILLAGGIPVPIYPPFRAHLLEAYTKTESRILRNAEVRCLITFDQAEKLSHLLRAFVPSLKWVTTTKELEQDGVLSSIFTPKEMNHAFIQYTSGSTSDPKGVLLTHYNLISNIRTFGQTVKINSDDVVVSWLPLYHDFGLIGAWLGSLYHGVPLILMTPFSFLTHPERWLWTIHYYRGTVSGAPNFAYDLCIRKIDSNRLEGLDLSSWRIAANGAEKVYPRTLVEFSKRFAAYGFKQETLLPVYGLAESTVGLTIPPLGRPFRIDQIDRKTFEEKKEAHPSTGSEKETLSFVSCGRPMAGHEIEIIDENGKVLPECHIGQLAFRGPSNMKGYFNNPEATAAICHDGWINSGDLAYLKDGEVFITGRKKDLIIKAGRNIYPVEIEELVGHVAGVRQGCVAAFGISDHHEGTEKLIIVAETQEKNTAKKNEIKQNIMSTLSTTLDIVPDDIVLAPPRIVPKTSSGKLQRSLCKTLYQQNKLSHTPLPAWLQAGKLITKWLGQQSWLSTKRIVRLLYTIYVGFIFLLTFIPLYLIILFSPARIADKTCRIWANILLSLAGCPIQLIGKNHLHSQTSVIYAANHASYLDALVAVAITPVGTRLVGKKELSKNFILRPFIKKLNVLLLDRLDFAKGQADTEQIKIALDNHDAIFIFPEGTFGYAQGLRPFRLGTFKLAAETNTPICPVALKGTRQILRDTQKLLTPGNISVTASKAIQPAGSEWKDIIDLREKVRAEIAAHCGEPSLDFIVAKTVAKG
jgi:fatty-acyl-CoA synthase